MLSSLIGQLEVEVIIVKGDLCVVFVPCDVRDGVAYDDTREKDWSVEANT